MLLELVELTAQNTDSSESTTLKDITPTMVAQFRDWRLGSVQAGTVIKDLNTVSHIFTTAIREWGVEAANPVLIIKKPKAPAGRLRFLTDGEIVKLLKESRKGHRENLYHFLLLQLHTGMRPSEGASLTWSQIDFDGRVIDLQKTKTDPRRVPLTVPALETLSKLVPAGDYKCGSFVFLPKEPKMTYLRRPNQYFRESFEAAIKRANISDFHMHDLRHTAASYVTIQRNFQMKQFASFLIKKVKGTTNFILKTFQKQHAE